MTANDKPWQMMMKFHNFGLNDDMRINMVLVDPKSCYVQVMLCVWSVIQFTVVCLWRILCGFQQPIHVSAAGGRADPPWVNCSEFPSSTGKAVLVGFLSHLGMLPHLQMTQVQEIGKGKKQRRKCQWFWHQQCQLMRFGLC